MAVEELAAVASHLLGTVPALARLLGELAARLFTRARRIQQRHGGPGHRAEDERDEHGSCVVPVV